MKHRFSRDDLKRLILPLFFEQLLVMLVGVASTVCVRLLLSVVFGIWMNLGVIGIAWAMVCDWIARAIIFTLRWRQGKWKTMRVV